MNLLDPQDDPTPTFDENTDYLSELVGEGKKFKDAAALARGKAEADVFIENLKREQAELRKDYLALREDYQARQSIEELLTKLPSVSPTTHEEPPEEPVNTPAGLKPEDIESLVSKKLQEVEMTRKQEQNYQSVQAKLLERFGSNYQTVLKNQISTLGLTEDFVNDLARNHPQVFYKTFGLDSAPQPSTFQAPPQSAIKTSFAPSTQKRDWNFYEKMRKEDAKTYWDPKTQLQMLQDKATLGDAFGNPL